MNVRKNVFTQRVPKHWNILEQYEVEAVKTGDFKERFDVNEPRRRMRRRNDAYVRN